MESEAASNVVRGPRTRGDEPLTYSDFNDGLAVVPAPAGMSPLYRSRRLLLLGGPRTRGDEPVSNAPAEAGHTWSPHPRG